MSALSCKLCRNPARCAKLFQHNSQCSASPWSSQAIGWFALAFGMCEWHEPGALQCAMLKGAATAMDKNSD